MTGRLSIKSRRIGIICILALAVVSVLVFLVLRKRPPPLTILSVDRMGTTIVCLTSNRSTFTVTFRAYGEARPNGKWEKINGSSRSFSPSPGLEAACQIYFPNTNAVWRVGIVFRRTSLTFVEKVKINWRSWFASHNMPKIASLVGQDSQHEELMYSPEYHY